MAASESSTELTTITNRSTPSTRAPTQDNHNNVDNAPEPENPYEMTYPLHHPHFPQQVIRPEEKINHFEDFKTFIKAYWASFVLTLWGLFIRTPRDIKDEVKYFFRNPKVILTEMLCGIAIAIVVLPEAIAFTGMVDMPPLAGLHSGMIICMACALLGARPAMISGAAASTFSILGTMAKSDTNLEAFTLEERSDIIFMAVIISGCFEVIISWANLAPYFILIPHSVLIAFVNALAISICKSQFHIFEKCLPVEDPAGVFTTPKFDQCPKDHLVWFNMGELELWLILILLAISILIMIFFPKIPKVGKIIPPSLIVFIICSLIEHLIFRKAFGVKTRTLKDSTPLQGGFPTFRIPKVTITATVNPWGQIFLYALYVGLVGCLESLLTVAAMNQSLRVRSTNEALNREAFAQGIGNIISGFFSSLGGCGTVGESLLNLINHSRHRLSAIVCSLVILVIILWATPIVNLIPMAALCAVILCITFHTFYWPTFIIWMHIRKSDIIIIAVSMTLSLLTNLGIGTVVGVAIGAMTLVLDSFNAFQVDIVDVNIPIPPSPNKVESISNGNQIPQDLQNNKEHLPGSPIPSFSQRDESGNESLQTLHLDNIISSSQIPPPITNNTMEASSQNKPNTKLPSLQHDDKGHPVDVPEGGENGGNNDEEDDEEDPPPAPGSIYALDNYQNIDHYICHFYFPAPASINNPIALPTTPNSYIKIPETPNESYEDDDNNDIDNNNNNDNNDNNNDNNYPQVTDLSSTPNNSEYQKDDKLIPNGRDLLIDVDPDAILNQTAYLAPVRIYRLRGTLFFGSIRAVTSSIVPSSDPEFVILDCSDVILTDYSASTTLVELLNQYSELNKRCKLVHVNSLQAQRTILRDRNLVQMVSRIDLTTYIVLTAREIEMQKEIVKKEKKEKADKKRQSRKAKNNQKIQSTPPS